MTAPSFAELQQARDRLIEAINKAMTEVVDLYNEPWRKGEVAESCDAAQEAFQKLAGMVALAGDRKLEASDFGELADGLRWLNDNPQESDWRADRADYYKGLMA